MTRLAIYPGSFDPPTRGHEDLARRSLALCDRLIVAVATNSQKQPLFSCRGTPRPAQGGDRSDPRSPSSVSTDCWPNSPGRMGARLVVARAPRGERFRV
jgi:pantetheine-phosphate adenylyltransferase